VPARVPFKSLLRPVLNSNRFGIYIHWPFCASKCPYCDFNSHVRDQIDTIQWEKALLQDLKSAHQETYEKTVTSIFFGGGTPSTMPPGLVSSLISHIHKWWQVDTDVEITLEANPTSIEQEKFQALSTAGINRVSLGIQSLNDKDLQFLGRTHNSQDAQNAMDTAAKIFSKHSFDFIYTLPHQSLDAWESELNTIIKRGAGHLSLYQLTIEEGTPFYLRHAKGEFQVPGVENSALFFERTREIMKSAGFSAYEVSNFATSPKSQCQHNLVYWNADDYIGIGPGAHGRFQKAGHRYFERRHRWPEKWMETVFANNAGVHESYNLSTKDRIEECLMMGLRLTEGISNSTFMKKTGHDFYTLFPRKEIAHLRNENLILSDGDRIQLSARGIQILDSILSFLFKHLILNKDHEHRDTA
jgi:putative oxygen-independent coproporphyrinogen III oxidase